jgi:DNA helicase-2/ATP-dependent DNA helicase PcrA
LRIIVNPRDELAWKRILKMIPSVGSATANKIYESIAYAENPLAMIKAEAKSLKAANEDQNENAGEQALETIKSKRAGEEIRSSHSTFRNASVPPKIRSKAGWQNFVNLIEILVRDENRNNPAKQIELILTNGYEQHLQETFENAEARLEDLRQLALYASRYDSTENFLSELALLSTERFKEPQNIIGEDVIEGGEEDELLTLTSVHQAKGLEWKAVFLIWAAEGKFPSPRSLKEIDSEEEERRLWYVALTRAQDELYLTYPLIITDYNRQTVLQKPSRFIMEVPPVLFEIWSLEEESREISAPISLQLDEPKDFIN